MQYGFRLGLVALLAAASGCVTEGNGIHGGGDQDLSMSGGDEPDLSIDQPPDLMPAALEVQPSALQTITVAAGASAPTVGYTATYGGVPINAAWSLDRTEVGSVSAGPSSSTTFTPRGSAGGLVTISAGVNGTVVTRQIQVNLTASQNGADASNPAEQSQIASTVPQLTAGGGVG